MERTVYIDILFFVNLIANYIVLYATSKMLRREESQFRIILGATAGAVYAVFIFFPVLIPIYSFAFRLAFSLLIVVIAFKTRGLISFLKSLLVFYAVNFMLGGGVMALYYFIGPIWGMQFNNGALYMDIPLPLFIISILICYIIIRVVSFLLQLQNGKRRLYEIGIEADGNVINTTALMDSGNSLYDPLSHKPVVIVEYKALYSIIPSLLHPIYENGLDLDCIGEVVSNSPWSGRFRIVSYNSLGGKGLVPAFKPDNLIIYKGDSEYKTKNVIIGVTLETLSDSGEYAALLHPQIVS